MGRSGTGFSLTSTRQRWSKRARGDRLWGEQSAQEESQRFSPARLATSPLAHRKSAASPARCDLRGRCLPGPPCRCSPSVGCPQWRSSRFDGLAPSAQCGFSDAPFLRPSRGRLALTVWQAFAGVRVHQKALVGTHGKVPCLFNLC